MLLYLIRHAIAVEADDFDGGDDAKRPLTKEGHSRFRDAVRMLAPAGFSPALVGTSPLARCLETADIIRQQLDGRPQVVELSALAPRSRLDRLIDWTNKQRADEVAWVGHAPDVGEMLAMLIGGDGAQIRFAKGAICAVEFADQVEPGAGVLRWLVTVKLLGA